MILSSSEICMRIYQEKSVHFVGIGIVKTDATKKIEGEWNLNVWHEEGNQNLLNKTLKKTFEEKWCWGTTFYADTLSDQSHMIITVKINDWRVTHL